MYELSITPSEYFEFLIRYKSNGFSIFPCVGAGWGWESTVYRFHYFYVTFCPCPQQKTTSLKYPFKSCLRIMKVRIFP